MFISVLFIISKSKNEIIPINSGMGKQIVVCHNVDIVLPSRTALHELNLKGLSVRCCRMRQEIYAVVCITASYSFVEQ